MTKSEVNRNPERKLNSRKEWPANGLISDPCTNHTSYSLRPSMLAALGSACSPEALKTLLETTEQGSEENLGTLQDLKKNGEGHYTNAFRFTRVKVYSHRLAPSVTQSTHLSELLRGHWAGDGTQLVKCFSSTHRTLGSRPSTA